MTDLPRLRDLEAFAAAAQAGSLGRAARSIGLSQPALSQAVDRLEARAGRALLRRGPGGSTPTEAGAVLLARWLRMQGELKAGLLGCRSAAPAACLTDVAAATHLAIVQAGSLAAAARLRGVSTPTLARTARGLEAALGVPLYRRAATGVTATPGGVEFARRCALALGEIEQGLAEIADDRSGRFRLGVLPMVPQVPLAHAIAAAAPGETFRVVVQDADHAELLRRLRHGTLDALLGALRPTAPAEDVEQEALRPDPYVVAAAAGHTLARAKRIVHAMLADAPWVVAEPPLPRRRTAEAIFATLPRRPRILLETNAPQATIALLREAGALALLSRQQIAATQGLVALPVEPGGPARTIGLTLRRGWLPTAAQQRVLQALRAAFAGT